MFWRESNRRFTHTITNECVRAIATLNDVANECGYVIILPS